MAGPNMDRGHRCPARRARGELDLKGRSLRAGQGIAYLASGPAISACKAENGEFVTAIELGSPARILEYDPCLDCVVTASGTDLVYVLSRDLKILHLLNPDLPNPLDMLRTFTLRKELHVVAVAGDHVARMTSQRYSEGARFRDPHGRPGHGLEAA